MSIKVNKRKMLWVLSNVVDFVGVTDLFHGKRVAFIADKIRSEFKGFPWDQNDVITAALLHDCGVSSTDVHEHLVGEMEWEGASEHCIRGEKLLSEQPDFCHLASSIGWHHTRWTDLPKCGSTILGNLLFLADRIDVLAATSTRDILIAREDIKEEINSLRGSLFCPELVDIFLRVSSRDLFWLNWSECQNGSQFQDWLDGEEETCVEYKELKTLFSLFSSCVDGKSTYTYNHSVGVSVLAEKIAELSGLSGEKQDEVALAGLMHDLGKLKIPDSILNKPGKLDYNEIKIMNHHSFDTHSILSRIPGLHEITKWAFQHHEKMNGFGYPEGVSDLPVESRIVAVADIFQALAQDRPYRKGLDLPGILRILEEMAGKREIDSSLVSLVANHADICLSAALSYVN